MTKILMACGNYWTSPFQVGSHHLARAFVKAGWQVAFVSDPISLLHVLNGVDNNLLERFKIYWRGGIWDCDGNIWAYVPGALATPHNKPILHSEWVYHYWYKFTWPDLIKITAKNSFYKVDVLYLDGLNQAFWLDVIPHDKSVFRITDNNAGFFKTTPVALKLEQQIARRVDLVVYSAKSLEPYVDSLQPKHAMHLPNGVNFDHFANGSKSLPQEYLNIKRPIAIYVGAMEVWFDFELVNTAAQQLPAISFVLIGPNQLARKHLINLPNIHLLGRRDYNALPAYLCNADIGIIPFDVKRHRDLVNSINPLKLYEYIACGLPVISVAWEELKNLRSPALLCDNPADFIKAISYSVSTKSLDRAPYINYAKTKDWSVSFRQLSDKL